MFALLFVIFDVEAVFLFPWAANIERYGTFGLVAMLVFIVLLARRTGLRLEARTAPMGVRLTVMTVMIVRRRCR